MKIKLEREENKKRVNKKRIIIYVAFIFILIYLIYAVYLLVKEPTDKVTVEKGTLYLEETNIGYIIRDEQVVKGNNYKNGMEQIKSEGEKTAKGESIYRYYSKNEEELKQQISDLDEKIHEALKGQTGVFSSDVKLLENQLDEKIEALSKLTDISKITEYKKQINDIITKKAKLTGETSEPSYEYVHSGQSTMYKDKSKWSLALRLGSIFFIPINDNTSIVLGGGYTYLPMNNKCSSWDACLGISWEF